MRAAVCVLRCMARRPVANFLLWLQSLAGHVLQDRQASGGGHEAGVWAPSIMNWLQLIAVLLATCIDVAVSWKGLRAVTALGTMPETRCCRYVFDGKPPKAKSEEISRR